MASIIEAASATAELPTEILFASDELLLLDEEQEAQIIRIATDVTEDLVLGAVSNNVRDFIRYYKRQLKHRFVLRQVDFTREVAESCGIYRSCDEDAVAASDLLMSRLPEELESLLYPEALEKIISSVIIKREGRVSTGHAALMLRWESFDMTQKLAIIDLKLARQMLLFSHPISCGQTQGSSDGQNSNQRGAAGPRPGEPHGRPTVFDLIQDDDDPEPLMQIKRANPPRTLGDESKPIYGVIGPGWRALERTPDGSPALPRMPKPFTLIVRAKISGKLPPGVPGVDLFHPEDGAECSIQDRLQFFVSTNELRMKYCIQPQNGRYSFRWRTYTKGFKPTTHGLDKLWKFFEEHEDRHQIHEFLKEVKGGIDLGEIKRALGSIIGLIQSPRLVPGHKRKRSGSGTNTQRRRKL